MTRRTLLEWLARAMGAACAAIVSVPAVGYLIDPLRRRPAEERDFKRVARLDGLPTNVPREFAVRDIRQDAWTLYPEETIGRVSELLISADGVLGGLVLWRNGLRAIGRH